MNMIDFMNLKRQVEQYKTEYMQAIERVVDDNAFAGGKYVKEFESDFARYLGIKECVGLSSGTSALFMAMKALGIKEEDEVIVPANTFIASAWGAYYCGAKVVFADCREDTWELDYDKLEEQITNKTKAIVGVHLYGQPFDIEKVLKIARAYNVELVEDCAQAHGAKYNGYNVGTMGKIGCFSFYPGKNLGAFGEAGAIVSEDDALCDNIRMMREHGSRVRYIHEIEGYNLRMDGIQASILSSKLRHIEEWNNLRKSVAKEYQKNIISSKIKLQLVPQYVDPVWHLFEVEVDNADRFIEYMYSNGVNCGRHYPVPCHLQKAFKSLDYKVGDFPNAEYHAEHCVSLPMYPELTKEEVDRVIDLCNRY